MTGQARLQAQRGAASGTASRVSSRRTLARIVDVDHRGTKVKYFKPSLVTIGAAIAAGAIHFAAFIATYFGTFAVTGGNFKIGPEDTGLPEIVFWLIGASVPALFAGLAAGIVVARKRRVAAMTSLITLLVAVAYVVIAVTYLRRDLEGDFVPHVLSPAVAVAAAWISLRVTRRA